METKDLYKNLNRGLEPQWDFYEKVFNVKPKKQKVYEEFDIEFEDDMYSTVLNNIDLLKENKWYRINDKEKIEAIKDLMDCGFLPDITFNDDFTKIIRRDTEYYLNTKK